MQAYGWAVGIVSQLRLKNVTAYWPIYTNDSDKNHSFDTYRDIKTHSRSKGLFMRNRIFPTDTYIVNPDRALLYAGSFIQHTSTGIERFTINGNTLWHEYIYPGRRSLNVKTYVPTRVSDITDPKNGQWAIHSVGLTGRTVYDKKSVPATIPSLDAMLAEFIPKLGMNPFTPDTILMYRTNLESFNYPDVLNYPPEPSSARAIIANDYTWLQFTGNLSTRDRDKAAQAAYVAAAEGIPQVTSNGVANVLEAASMLSSLLLGDFKKSANVVGDAWLAYRYSYCTTKLDIEEYQSYVQRIIDLTDLTAPPSYRCHGTYVDSDGWKYHCVMRVKTSESLPSTLTDVVRDFGFQLSAVSAWDMIPYSFIVDWFLPVSDILGSYESHMKSQHLPIMECWMSVTSPKGDQYFRFPYKWRNIAPEIRQKDVSSKTLWMRIADTIALFM
jgi:hypothetical protein